MSEANKTVLTKKTKLKIKIWFLTALTLVLISSPTYAVTRHEIDIFRLYAHSQIVDYSQFQCFDKLILRESNYNPKAINKGHYGIVQGGSKWLKDQDPFTQIDWGIKYVAHRYHGSWCLALEHSNRRGWY